MIIADGPEDHENAMDMVRLLRSIPTDPQLVRTRLPPPPADGPMPGQRFELFVQQFKQKQRAEANKLDTAFTMRLFAGIVGDKPLAEVGAEDMNRFLNAPGNGGRWLTGSSSSAERDIAPPGTTVSRRRPDGACLVP